MRNKFRFIAIFSAAILVAVSSGLVVSSKYSKSLALRWFISYAQGDDADARRAAERLRWLDSKRSAYALAQMAMSDAFSMTGRQRTETLGHSLSALEKSGPYGDDGYWFFWREAALASLLGDREKAKRYLHEACGRNREKAGLDDKACLDEAYRSSKESMLHSTVLRHDAMRLYEVVEVARVVGGLDNDEIVFDEALVMIAFNAGGAIEKRGELFKDGKMTPKRVEELDKVLRLSEEPIAPFTIQSATSSASAL